MVDADRDRDRAAASHVLAPFTGGWPDLCPEEVMVGSDRGDAVTLVCVLAAGHAAPHWDARQVIWWHDPGAEPGAAEQPGA